MKAVDEQRLASACKDLLELREQLSILTALVGPMKKDIRAKHAYIEAVGTTDLLKQELADKYSTLNDLYAHIKRVMDLIERLELVISVGRHLRRINYTLSQY